MPFKFSENTKVDSLDAVPEDFRSLYSEGADGGFVIADPHQKMAAAFDGVGRALGAARTEAKDAKGRVVDLAPLSEFGESVEEISTSVKTKLDELTEQLAQGGKAKLNLDKIKEDMGKAHSVALEAKDQRIGALTGQLHKLLVSNVATVAISEAKGEPELLMPFVANQVKVIEEDGEMRVFVVDAAGDRRFSMVTGEPMTIKELVNGMKGDEKFSRLFDSETKGGGGAENSKGSVRMPNNNKGADRSAVDKIAAGLKAGNHQRR
jgi:hypothetical protein